MLSTSFFTDISKITLVSGLLLSSTVIYRVYSFKNTKMNYKDYCKRFNAKNCEKNDFPITLKEHKSQNSQGYKFSELDKIKNITSNSIYIYAEIFKISEDEILKKYFKCCSEGSVECFESMRNDSRYSNIFNPK